MSIDREYITTQGFEGQTSIDNVGVGWHPLVERAFDLLDANGLVWTVSQIKEKFGKLRIYIEIVDEHLTSEDEKWIARVIIDATESESGNTCEECGKRGRCEPVYGWYKTLCDGHRADAWDGRRMRASTQTEK